MIRAALCDGDKRERERLRSMLGRFQLTVEVTEYDAIEALLWDMETDEARYDLYILPFGAESMDRLRAMDGEAPLILIAGNADSGDSDARTVGRLERPVEEKALHALLEKAAERLRQYRRRVVVIAQRGHTHVLRFEDIEYISSANHTLRFHLRGGEERICYGQMDKISTQLDPELFLRCHQSHIINLAYVTGYTAKTFHMASAVIPISRSYALQARRAVEEYLYCALTDPGGRPDPAKQGESKCACKGTKQPVR